MHIIYIFFIAVLNSIDNLGIGVAYSISRKKVPVLKNILIAAMAFAVCYVSSMSGYIISHYLSDRICVVISTILLVLMGLIMIYQSFEERDSENFKKYNVISNKEVATIGALLALDDIGSAVSLGLMGYGPYEVSITYFLISFAIFSISNLGSRLVIKLRVGRKVVTLSGILMILLGVLQLLN